MTVLFICNEYPPGKSGGIGSMTRVLARGMVRAGHEVLVAGLYKPGYGEKDYEEDEGVKVWRRRYRSDIGLIRNDYSMTDTMLIKLMQITGIWGWDTRKSVAAFSSFLIELIGKYTVGIVEWPDFNEYFPYLPTSFQWPRLPAPLIVKCHGSPSYIALGMKERIDPVTFREEKKHLERADVLVAVSKYAADTYQTLYGELKPMTILYNSIDLPPKMYCPAEVTSTVVFTGTLTPLKGVYSLLKAWNLVHAVRPDARLRIFGKGRPNVLQATLDVRARETVIFEGYVTREQLYKAFSTAATAIFPSYVEAFANAPLEAMAVGCPVIYTTRASGPELIEPGVNGLLVDPDDIRGIADAILLLLDDARLRDDFSLNGRLTVERRFDLRQSIKDHLSLYEQHARKYSITH